MRKFAAPLPIGLFLIAFAYAQAPPEPSPLEAPQPIPGLNVERFGVDRTHSVLDFTVEFLGVTPVRGTFDDYDAAILYDEDDPTRTSITLVIDVASIDTNNEWRDNDLRSERFFHAEAHPHIVFQSERIKAAGNGFVAHGLLTMRGVTKTIAVPFKRTLPRTVDNVWGNVRIGFAGSLTLDRTAFGVNGNDFWGGMVLSKEVQIDFHLLGTISNVARWSFGSREKPSIGETLEQTIANEGVQAAVRQFHRLRAEAPDAYNFSEGQMSLLAYKLLQRRQMDDAAAILHLYVEAFPESANAYDSLGEFYALQGNLEQALINYRKALALDPASANAMELVRRLEAS